MRIRKKVIIKVLIAIILLILSVWLALFLKEFFFSSDAKVIYGTRLKGINKHKISKETISSVEDSIKKEVSSVNVRVTGKLIYIVIKVKENTTLETAKALGAKAIEGFSADEKTFYDIQIMIDSESENSQYPIIGYKQRSRQNITWTKDRVS